jgi:hypothetical protein
MEPSQSKYRNYNHAPKSIPIEIKILTLNKTISNYTVIIQILYWSGLIWWWKMCFVLYLSIKIYTVRCLNYLRWDSSITRSDVRGPHFSPTIRRRQWTGGCLLVPSLCRSSGLRSQLAQPLPLLAKSPYFREFSSKMVNITNLYTLLSSQ